VHAPSKKFVFAVVAEVCRDGVLPRQHTLAVLEVVQEGSKSSVGHDFQAAMKTHPGAFAVFEEDAILGHILATQQITKPLGDEDCCWVALHYPRKTLPCCLLTDLLPHSQEDWRVHPVLCVRPAQNVRVENLDSLSGFQGHLYVAINCPMIACKDMRLPFLCLFEDVQLVASLLATI